MPRPHTGGWLWWVVALASVTSLAPLGAGLPPATEPHLARSLRRNLSVSTPSVSTGNQTLPVKLGGGYVHIANGTIIFNGTIKYSGDKQIQSCHGTLRLGADEIRWPARRPAVFTLEGFQTTGQLNIWHKPATVRHIRLNHGATRFAGLVWQTQYLRKGYAKWRIRNGILRMADFRAWWGKARITMKGNYSLRRADGDLAIDINQLNQKTLFSLLAPSRLSIDGRACLQARFSFNRRGEIIGSIDLRSAGPGLLKVRDIPILERAFAGAYGQGMAYVTMQELKEYPYRQEDIRIVAAKDQTTLFLHFLRGTGNPGHLQPHYVTFAGKRFLVKAGGLKTIHLTIPFPHLPLRELLVLIRRFSS